MKGCSQSGFEWCVMSLWSGKVSMSGTGKGLWMSETWGSISYLWGISISWPCISSSFSSSPLLLTLDTIPPPFSVLRSLLASAAQNIKRSLLPVFFSLSHVHYIQFTVNSINKLFSHKIDYFSVLSLQFTLHNIQLEQAWLIVSLSRLELLLYPTTSSRPVEIKYRVHRCLCLTCSDWNPCTPYSLESCPLVRCLATRLQANHASMLTWVFIAQLSNPIPQAHLGRTWGTSL